VLTLVTETNLFTRRGAYLPPSLPNLGTACLAGAVRAQGCKATVVPWYELYLKTVCVDSATTTLEAVRRHGPARAPFLASVLTRGGPRGLLDCLRRVYRWATSDRLVDYLVPERTLLLQRVLRDLHALQVTLASHPSDLGAPAVDVFVERCRAAGNDLVGVSVAAFDEPLSRALVTRLSREGFEVVVGGSLTSTTPPSLLARTCLDEWRATWVLRGEADATLPQLISARGSARGLDTIPGLVGRVNGHLLEGADLPRSGPGDGPIPDFSDFDLSAYYFPWPMLPLQSSRGCYWKACAFCRREIAGRSHWEIPVEHLVRTLRAYRALHGVRHVVLCDEALPPDHGKRFARALLDAADDLGDLRYCCAARPDAGFTPEVMAELARTGLRLVFWGIESGCQRTLDRMRKGTQVDANAGLLQQARQAGLSNLAFVMIGFPGETREEALETAGFLERNRRSIDYSRVNPFQLEQGTAVSRHPEQFGVSVLDEGSPDGGLRYRVAQGLDPHEAMDLARRIAAGELGPISSERYFPMPALGFGEEPILHYFLQRLIGLSRTKPATDGEEDARGPPPLLERFAAAGRLAWITDRRGGAG
jgi:hypothetical protein